MTDFLNFVSPSRIGLRESEAKLSSSASVVKQSGCLLAKRPGILFHAEAVCMAARLVALSVLLLKCGTMERRELLVRRIGRIDYAAALNLQKETERAVILRTQPDTMLLLEHPHVITIGRRGNNSSLLTSRELLEAQGVSLFETNRGGKLTYHGLGQVVGYPIVNLSPDREDVHRYVRDLEEVLIRTMSDFNIEAFRIQGLTGVHTANGKIAAIGVHLARWVTTHGFALNVNTDLSFFDLIVACEGEPVTSMKKLLGSELDLSVIEDHIIEHFAAVFDFIATEATVEV